MRRARRFLARGRPSVSPPDPGDTLVGPGSGVGGSDYQFAPILYDRALHRTVLVSADDAAIDLQGEVAHPGSPVVTEWTVGGEDVALWDLDDGKVKPKAGVTEGTTHSLTVKGSNTYGESETVALTVIVPLNANCRFCDFAGGVDAGTGRGLTPATAWKQMPRSAGFTGTQVTLGAGVVTFFKGEVYHRYGLWTTTSGYAPLPHEGVDGNQFVYSFSGWGGRAVFDGSELLSAGVPVTEEEVDGNPNWANLRKVSLGTTGAVWNHLFNGPDMLFAAQSPKPADLRVFEGPQDPTGTQGMFQAATTTSTGVSPRINKTGTDVITLVDARLNALIGPDADPTGRFLVYWIGGDIAVAPITSWDSATSTLTATSTLGPRGTTSAWCLQLLPYSIEVEGQYAYSADRLTAYYWPTNDGDVSIGRLNRAMTVGGINYVTIAGGAWRGYCSSSTVGGGGYVFTNSARTCVGVQIIDHDIRHNRPEGGDGLIAGTGGGVYWDKTMIERIHYSDINPKACGVKIANEFRAATGGTPEEVRAFPTGKVRYCYFAPNSLMRTAIYFSQADGGHVHSNILRDQSSLHGNGISLYDQGAGSAGYSQYFVVEQNLCDNAVRGYTMALSGGSAGDTSIDRHNLITRNIFLGNPNDQGFVMALYSGEPGSTISQNIIMGAEGWDYPQAVNAAAGNRVKFLNNVMAGVSRSVVLADCTYTSEDNLYTVNSMLPDDGPTRVSSGDTLMTGAPVKVWDRTFSPAMEATLGPGPIGLFWNIAA